MNINHKQGKLVIVLINILTDSCWCPVTPISLKREGLRAQAYYLRETLNKRTIKKKGLYPKWGRGKYLTYHCLFFLQEI